nr:MFS transporter [Virgibacillus indicus]
MFNVALPSIIIDFSLNSSTASWLVSGYSIMFAIASLAFSRLSDFIPISRLLFFGLSILGIASIIGFFSNHFLLLLGTRNLDLIKKPSETIKCKMLIKTCMSVKI